MSTIIKVRCTDQVLTFENTPVIASGGLEEDFVSFAFCSKWDGLVKTAVFWRSEEEVYHVLLDEADSCPIPREVLAVEGVIYFGVFGVSEAGKQRTSEVLRYNVVKGAITEGTKPTDPTPDIYTQILAEFLRYENEIDAKLDDFAHSWAEYQAAMNQARTNHEEAVARWQEDLETAVSETQDAYESRMNQEWENFKTGGDFVLKVDYEKDQEEQEQAMTTLEDKVDEVEQTANDALAGLGLVAAKGEKIASYETAGSYEWTAPDLADGKAYKIGVLIIGAGAGGGACVNPTSSGAYYAPGGPSGFSATFVGSVNPGEVVPVVVGAGGQPATKTDSDVAGVGGNAGGSSSFNGVVASGGPSSSRSSTVATSPVLVNGASPSRCTSSASANLKGVWGGAMLILSNSTTIVGRPEQCINPFTGERILGSGGGAYSTTSGTDSAVAGVGGKDPLTGLGGGNGAAAADGTAAIAEDASLPGCGGGAANVAGKSTSATSGAGADGAVYIYFLGVADE